MIRIRRIFATAVFAIVLTLSFSVQSYAYEPSLTGSGTCGTDASWEYYAETGELRILGSGDMWDYSSSAPWVNYADQITTVSIGSGITSIGRRSFADCSVLSDISIANTVERIGESAFSSCTSLETIEIPSSVQSLGRCSFLWCSSLSNITLHEGLIEIGEAAFQCDGLTELSIPASVTNIGDGVFVGCESLTQINVVQGNAVYSSSDGVLYDKDRHTLLQYPCGKMDVSFSIPETVQTIGVSAFHSAKALTSLVIPDSVITIESGAFAYCASINSIYVPSSVTSVGVSAFAGSGIETCILSSGMTDIPINCFYNCKKLTTVTIPHSISTIQKICFKLCDSLSTIIFEGTESDWDKITIEESNDSLATARIQYHTNHSGGSATCYQKAKCEDCGLEYGGLDHQMNSIDAVSPTCTEKGNILYFYCSLCERYFSNPDGFASDEISCNSTIIIPLGHDISNGQCCRCGLVESSISALFAGGDGTAESPLLIETKEQLDLVGDYVHSNYCLIDDIICTTENSSWNPIAPKQDDPFTGTFDGNGKQIVGLTSSSNAFGFIRFNSGTVKNLSIVDFDVHIDYVPRTPGAIYYGESLPANGASFVYTNDGVVSNCSFYGTLSVEEGVAGGIVCYNQNTGIVKGCVNYGKLTVVNEAGGNCFVGGIVAENNGLVMECKNTSTLQASADVRYYAVVGGICGNSTGSITECINFGKISAFSIWDSVNHGSPSYVGGIAGNATIIRNCYNKGFVGSSNYGGGIAGYAELVDCCYSTVEITGEIGFDFEYYDGFPLCHGYIVGSGHATNCYYPDVVRNEYGGLINTSLDAAVGVGTNQNCLRLSDDEFMLEEKLTGFDFNEVWFIESSTPELRCFSNITGLVFLNDFEAPEKGKTPDCSVILPECLVFENVKWYDDSTNTEVTGEFGAFSIYRAEISFSVRAGYCLTDFVRVVTPSGATSVTIDKNNCVIIVVYSPTARNLLKGSCTISGQPYYGFTLRAVVESNNTGGLSYQWKRNNIDIEGAVSDTYLVTEEDIGTVITCSIESDIEAGAISSTNSICISSEQVQAHVESTRQDNCIHFSIQKASYVSNSITVLVCQYDGNNRMVAVYMNNIDFCDTDLYDGNTENVFSHIDGFRYKIFVVLEGSLIPLMSVQEVF